ncbi:MAG TPA: hypothetical protein VKD23_07190 [Terriglobales bacterium]|nr:hypothetical protein [Terriglobales bacterium]
MSAASVYVAIAIVLAAVFTYLAARRRRSPLAIDKARALMSSLDIEAFRNLVDPDEEAFLRSNLPPDEFKAIQRERAWAALAYMRALSHIALEFSRSGHAMYNSSDPRLAELGRQIVNDAVYLRLRALETSGRLFVAATFPNLTQRYPKSLFEQYEHSSGLLLRYGMLERARRQAS